MIAILNFLSLLLMLIPFLFGVVVKDVLETIEFSTDYDPDDPGSATWTAISVLRIRQAGSERPSGTPQNQTMIAGHEAQAAELSSGSYAIVTDDGTGSNPNGAALESLRTYADNIDPVWFRETPSGHDPRVIGGAVGCILTWGRQRGGFGDFEVVMVAFTATGASPDSTFTIESGS